MKDDLNHTTMRPFFDIHCHLMSFDEPDFIMFLKQIGDNMSKEAFNSMLSPDYLLDFKNKHLPTKVGNLINVMSHSQKEMAEIMEGDLKGDYIDDAKLAFIQEDEFHFANQSFDKFVICPMVMDFTNRHPLENIHYKSRSPKDAFWYDDKMLESISLFYKENKNSMVEILPFAGINPPSYSLEEVEQWLHKYFKRFKTSEHYQNRRRPHFFGIKLYPPLGFNPVPTEEEEIAKVECIYAFAEKNMIPITTHCDDGGYRITDVETSHKNTSPDSWVKVLEKYPKLKLNFAHFGRQYHRNRFLQKQEKWRNEIIDLILTYDNVYADFSFNGVSSDYYEDLVAKFTQLKSYELEKLSARLMFGSDFMINLSKVKSYHHYLKIYEASPLSEVHKLNFAGLNCRRFLFEL